MSGSSQHPSGFRTGSPRRVSISSWPSYGRRHRRRAGRGLRGWRVLELQHDRRAQSKLLEVNGFTIRPISRIDNGRLAVGGEFTPFMVIGYFGLTTFLTAFAFWLLPRLDQAEDHLRAPRGCTRNPDHVRCRFHPVFWISETFCSGQVLTWAPWPNIIFQGMLSKRQMVYCQFIASCWIQISYWKINEGRGLIFAFSHIYI